MTTFKCRIAPNVKSYKIGNEIFLCWRDIAARFNLSKRVAAKAIKKKQMPDGTMIKFIIQPR
jgi:hypothetical protein